jgi:hypothetical protein
MPFDALPSPDTASPITAKPSLEALAWALRHLDEVDPAFRWDYGNCNTCAIGLAARLWGITDFDRNPSVSDIMSRSFSMPFDVACSIFLYLHATNGDRPEQITPAHVASAIDRYLASSR